MTGTRCGSWMVVLAALSIGAAGCAPNLRDVWLNSRYTYDKGELEREYRAKPDAAMAACLEGVKALGAEIVGQTKTEAGGTIQALRDDGVTPIAITVAALDAKSIAVRVKVGQTGDRSASMQIHQKIADNL